METPIRVLIVDDEERFRENMAKLLRLKGFAPEAVGDGQAALAAVAQRPYDVVLLDVKMPGMDGVAVIRGLKAAGCSAQVIFLTGHASVDDAVEGLKHGAFDYLLKPCGIDELVDKITHAHERKLESARPL